MTVENVRFPACSLMTSQCMLWYGSRRDRQAKCTSRGDYIFDITAEPVGL